MVQINWAPEGDSIDIGDTLGSMGVVIWIFKLDNEWLIEAWERIGKA